MMTLSKNTNELKITDQTNGKNKKYRSRSRKNGTIYQNYPYSFYSRKL